MAIQISVKFTSVSRLCLYRNLAMDYSNSKPTEIKIDLFKMVLKLHLLDGFVYFVTRKLFETD